MTRPQGLGEQAEKDYILVEETHDPEGGREGLLKTIKEIISGGGVMRMLVEKGRPIQVKRYVEKGTIPDIQDQPEEDLFLAARNAEILELIDDASPFALMFKAFHIMFLRDRKPTKLLVHKHSELRTWLGLDELTDVSEIYGLETHEEKELPEGSVLLVSMVNDAPNMVALSVRIPMMIRPTGVST